MKELRVTAAHVVERVGPLLPPGFIIEAVSESGLRITDPDGSWVHQGCDGPVEEDFLGGIEDVVSEHTTEPFALDPEVLR